LSWSRGVGAEVAQSSPESLLSALPQIQQAIHGNLQKHTVLIIAHRLSTVERAHLIVVLDKGRVVQQGTHQQLLAQGGLYAKLVQRQMLGLEAPSEYTASHKEPPGNGSHKA
jgi:ATP-binding cassette subfamily B (MDR/TAP) protein 9